MASVTFYFRNYLKELLKKEFRTTLSFVHHFNRKASIKDIIESLGVPHPIVGKLVVNEQGVNFDYILHDGDTVEVVPLQIPVDPCIPTILRPDPLDRIAFVVDVNVGKLALLLRTLGFDTLYSHNVRNGLLAEISHSENRILLTRDTALLKRKIVMHAYLLRAQHPTRQLIEVIRLYDLSNKIKPLSRCIPCNGMLVPTGKEDIMDRLEPLTKKYYESFHICKECKKIYWAGSHQEKIVAFIENILAAVKMEANEQLANTYLKKKIKK